MARAQAPCTAAAGPLELVLVVARAWAAPSRQNLTSFGRASLRHSTRCAPVLSLPSLCAGSRSPGRAIQAELTRVWLQAPAAEGGDGRQAAVGGAVPATAAGATNAIAGGSGPAGAAAPAATAARAAPAAAAALAPGQTPAPAGGLLRVLRGSAAVTSPAAPGGHADAATTAAAEAAGAEALATGTTTGGGAATSGAAATGGERGSGGDGGCGRRVPSRLQPWACGACTFENMAGAKK